MTSSTLFDPYDSFMAHVQQLVPGHEENI